MSRSTDFFCGHPDTLPDRLKSAAVAIGNFDGVHKGHYAVLEQTLAIAKRESLPALALTFDPHPRTFFMPDRPVFRLSDNATKAQLFARFGLDGMLVQPFNKALSSMSAEDFIQKILLETIGAKHIMAGEDFHFGHKRSGTPEFLRNAGKEHGFGVWQIPAFCDAHGNIISSSRIRQALENGDIKTANQLLGHRYTVSGKIIKGAQLGRELGFPTANMELPIDNQLRHGIYAVRFITQNGKTYDGVASFGKRPSIDDDDSPRLETFIFDFSGDLYGQEARVEFVGWIRAEEKFDVIEDLITQMDKDCQAARDILSR